MHTHIDVFDVIDGKPFMVSHFGHLSPAFLAIQHASLSVGTKTWQGLDGVQASHGNVIATSRWIDSRIGRPAPWPVPLCSAVRR
jgi:hypothetical protein